MTTINDKMGFKRAGKRPFMKNLPANRAEAATITSATCPHCQIRGKASLSKTQPGWLFCTRCCQTYERPS